MQTVQKMPETREQAVTIFEKWINQRPRLDPRNYIGDYRDGSGERAYRQEHASIRLEQGRALEALRVFGDMPYDPEMLRAAMSHAFSGRLQFNERGELDYCTGQYWPTEYRPAAAAVLEQYVSDMRREGIGIPESAQKLHGEPITVSELKAIASGHGSHFFDPESMRFFNSRVHGPVLTGGDGWYFVTSEQNDGAFGGTHNPRKYTVRRMDKEGDFSEPEEGGHDNFQKYETAAQAQKVVRQLAEQSREG